MAHSFRSKVKAAKPPSAPAPCRSGVRGRPGRRRLPARSETATIAKSQILPCSAEAELTDEVNSPVRPKGRTPTSEKSRGACFQSFPGAGNAPPSARRAGASRNVGRRRHGMAFATRGKEKIDSVNCQNGFPIVKYKIATEKENFSIDFSRFCIYTKEMVFLFSPTGKCSKIGKTTAL